MIGSQTESIAELLLAAPVTQQRASLLLSCVHDVLLSGVDHELAQWLPTVVEDPRPVVQGSQSLRTAFTQFVSDYRGELTERIATRVVQTNEVSRVAPLRLALAHLSMTYDQPKISLIEVGAAAGLLLALDAYQVNYGPQQMAPSLTGPTNVPTLATQMRGRDVPESWLHQSLQIVERIGIDPSPLSYASEADQRWLHACIWPSQAERHRRAEEALQIARTVGVRVVDGDAADIGGIIADQRSDTMPVVLSSWTLAYLDEAAQRHFIDSIAHQGAARPVALVCLEGAGLVPGVAAPHEFPADELSLVLSTSVFDGNGRTNYCHGTASGQGTWARLS